MKKVWYEVFKTKHVEGKGMYVEQHMFVDKFETYKKAISWVKENREPLYLYLYIAKRSTVK